jgi:hypothetical protein
VDRRWVIEASGLRARDRLIDDRPTFPGVISFRLPSRGKVWPPRPLELRSRPGSWPSRPHSCWPRHRCDNCVRSQYDRVQSLDVSAGPFVRRDEELDPRGDTLDPRLAELPAGAGSSQSVEERELGPDGEPIKRVLSGHSRIE